MDSLALLERLDQLMAEAKPVPLTREARVDRDEVFTILDQIRTTLPVEFERARWMGRGDDHGEELESQLRQIGNSIAELRRAQRAQADPPSRPPVTTAAAEQVREIIEAAERTASGLEQEAASEARRLREEAERTLRAAREESERLLRESRERAAGEAATYLRDVEEATKKMLERADAAGSEIDGMLARLRGSGGSVIEDLEAIMSGLNELEVRRQGKATKPTAGPSPRAPAASGSATSSGPNPRAGATRTPAPGTPAQATRQPPARAPGRVPAPQPAGVRRIGTARQPLPRTEMPSAPADVAARTDLPPGWGEEDDPRAEELERPPEVHREARRRPDARRRPEDRPRPPHPAGPSAA